MGMLNNRRDHVVDCSNSPSRTKQANRKACDINHIVARARNGGVVSGNAKVPMYIDVTNMPADYFTAVNQIRAAQDMFDRYPAKLRARFGYNPGKLIEFVSDPKNAQECVKLGLLPETAVQSAPPAVAPTGATEPPK